ncbi:MAG: DivIVA domain-containing protein [Microbacterium sp.]
MALTPDDVVTKQFQHVRFKEGFDPDEVDDYLDEIVVEWRKVIEENEQLKARIAELEQQPAAETSSAAAAPAEAAPAPVVAPAAQAPVAEPAADQSAEGTAATSALGILERAQRLHDEHVAEGKSEAEKLISDARTEAGDIVEKANKERQEVRNKLETERKSLEGRITELRTFERDYRQELRSYFETKLKDLDTNSSGSSDTPVSAIGL